jgi:hypothetical protein
MVYLSNACTPMHLEVSADADRREVAHQPLVDVVDKRITAIDLLCSGFIEPPDPTEVRDAG